MRNAIFSYTSDLRNSFLALFMWSEVKVKVKCRSHTPAARRCFRPHHPLAATSCGDCSVRPRIDIGSKSCRRDLPSYSCRSLHMLSLQHDSGNWSRPWEREALSDQDRCTVIGRQPSSPTRSCWYLDQCWSAAFHNVICRWARCTWRSRLALFGERLRSLAWPSSLFTGYTSHLPWVCLVSGSTVHKRRTVQPPEGPIAWRLPPRGHGRERGNCVRHRVYLPGRSDGRTTTTSPTGADLLLSIVCSTSNFGWWVRVSAAGQQGGSDESARNQAVLASLTRYSHRRWTTTTIPCYVALWRRSLSSGGINESQTCFSSRRVCSGVWPVRSHITQGPRADAARCELQPSIQQSSFKQRRNTEEQSQ